MGNAADLKLSLTDFLAWENAQPDRHEFYRGEIFAMVGARRGHGCIVANLLRHIGNQLDGSPCRVFSESMKIMIADDTILYPDVFITCDAADLRTELIFTAPTVVIEVLSPSTQGYDRGAKFALYRRLKSLREYILIDPDSRSVEGFRRGDDGKWVLHDMSEVDQIELAALDCRIAMTQVFAGVTAEE
jgi:Uma2 family endonuclease